MSAGVPLSVHRPVSRRVTRRSISGLLEAEVFIAENFSVSGAHGFAIENNDPAIGESTTDYGTVGADFSHIGFHAYIW